MSNNATKFEKQSYLFVFKNEESASSFLSKANKHSDTFLAQHPYSRNERCSRDMKQVLVTSSKFNVGLKDSLLKQAEELGGFYFPKV